MVSKIDLLLLIGAIATSAQEYDLNTADQTHTYNLLKKTCQRSLLQLTTNIQSQLWDIS